MAENILIGPTVVPIRGKEAEASSQSPQLAQVRQATDRLQHMLGELTRSTAEQENANTDASAYIDYKEQLDKLRENTDSIIDPTTRLNVYKAGSDDIIENLKKSYPTLKTSTVARIRIGAADSLSEYTLKTTAESRTRADRESKRILEDLIHSAAKATSTADLNRDEVSADKVIESRHVNGFISKEEADAERINFHYNVHKETMGTMAIENPDKFIKLSLADSGLHYNDFLALHHAADGEITARKNSADASFEEDRSKADQMIHDNPGAVNDPWVRSHAHPWIVAASRPPISEAEVKSKSDYMLSLEDPNEIKKYYRDNVLPFSMTPEGAKVLSQARTDAIHAATDAIAKRIALDQRSLKELITNRLPPMTIPGAHNRQLEVLLQRIAAMKDLPFKSPDQVDEQAAKFQQEIHDLLPLPSDKKPKAAPAATPGTPTAEATPAPVPSSELAGIPSPGSAPTIDMSMPVPTYPGGTATPTPETTPAGVSALPSESETPEASPTPEAAYDFRKAPPPTP